ncbi:MAG: calcium/sodium antiporter [Muribaculaceae bacterium]|nr:calcium/sodium antiporter [Muribaculaceae bacterium]MBQ7205661.1 calcium/sodium antiporter [Muribaculaceae bacterium]
MDYLLLIVGLGLLLLAANYLVDSSVAIAQRAKISNFIIGLTIVGIGTSSPELFVSIKSALSDSGDIAMGNVIGSNIANIFLILGVTAIICPFAIERLQRIRDIPFLIFMSLLVMAIANDSIVPGLDSSLNRLDGIVLLLVFIGYMGWVVIQKGKDPKKALQDADEEASSSLTGKSLWLLWPIALASLVLLIYGGNLFLDSAKKLAAAWGMSEAAIAITIVAVGTSLPELVTAVIAASKHNPQLALGNVIGSNLFNLMFILGAASTVKPLYFQSINIIDYTVMIVAAFMLYMVIYTFKKNKFDRVEGIIFFAAYVAYTIYLLVR